MSFQYESTHLNWTINPVQAGRCAPSKWFFILYLNFLINSGPPKNSTNLFKL
jgi:hypothetical protein